MHKLNEHIGSHVEAKLGLFRLGEPQPAKEGDRLVGMIEPVEILRDGRNKVNKIVDDIDKANR